MKKFKRKHDKVLRKKDLHMIFYKNCIVCIFISEKLFIDNLSNYFSLKKYYKYILLDFRMSATPNFSGIIQINDLDDFIGPGQVILNFSNLYSQKN